MGPTGDSRLESEVPMAVFQPRHDGSSRWQLTMAAMDDCLPGHFRGSRAQRESARTEGGARRSGLG